MPRRLCRLVAMIRLSCALVPFGVLRMANQDQAGPSDENNLQFDLLEHLPTPAATDNPMEFSENSARFAMELGHSLFFLSAHYRELGIRVQAQRRAIVAQTHRLDRIKEIAEGAVEHTGNSNNRDVVRLKASLEKIIRIVRGISEN